GRWNPRPGRRPGGPPAARVARRGRGARGRPIRVWTPPPREVGPARSVPPPPRASSPPTVRAIRGPDGTRRGQRPATAADPARRPAHSGPAAPRGDPIGGQATTPPPTRA